MATRAEKIEASKICCRKVRDYVSEKKNAAFNRLFNGDLEVFVVKQDEKTGEFVGKTTCCALCPV
jgi:hypothetical protein